MCLVLLFPHLNIAFEVIESHSGLRVYTVHTVLLFLGAQLVYTCGISTAEISPTASGYWLEDDK